MNKIYTLLSLFFVSVLMTACNNSNPKHTNHQASPSSTDHHTISLTINGNEFNNETITIAIPNEDAAAMYSPTPVGSHKAIIFSASKDNKSINANFIKKDNFLLPLGKNSGDESNFDHSIITFTFIYNGQTYTMSSLSGTCTEKSFELHSSGVIAAISIEFDGIFSGGPSNTNDPKEFNVKGTIDIKLPMD